MKLTLHMTRVRATILRTPAGAKSTGWKNAARRAAVKCAALAALIMISGPASAQLYVNNDGYGLEYNYDNFADEQEYLTDKEYADGDGYGEDENEYGYDYVYGYDEAYDDYDSEDDLFD